MADADGSRYVLSEDGMTLTIGRLVAGKGLLLIATYYRQPGTGPFTDADIARALSYRVSATMQPGQRNRGRRKQTRFGTLWTHVMLGPPTWWLPKVRLEKDGTVMAGWLRGAVAVRFEFPRRRPPRPEAGDG